MDTQTDFLEIHKETISTLGFWTEMYKATVMAVIEQMYKPHVRDNYEITDMVINGDDVLVKWQKRMFAENTGIGGAEQ